MSNTFRGTVQEFISRGLKINGEPIKQAEFSVLARVGGESFAKNVGNVPRADGQRGKPATLWELNPSASFNVTMG